MKVIAVRAGYYKNTYREVGDIFEIASKEELGSWMELEAPVEIKAEVKKSKIKDEKISDLI